MKKNISLLLIGICFYLGASAQILTKQDSLNAHLTANNNATEISGYGQAKVQYNVPFGTATADLTRNVLFVGHKFNNNISFFSEWEVEDAKVAGGEPGGEVSMEQCFLKFDLNKDMYLVGGLFTPRIGIMNENHLPTTFYGNDRSFVETLIIPTTWREIGVGLYGDIPSMPGLNYSLGLVNGLNSQGFSMDQGIGEAGLFEGKNATASNLAVTGSLLYYIGDFRIQASGYYGGTVGLAKRQADSLQLNYGPFGTPVGLGEFDLQYLTKLFTVKALATMESIPDAYEINRAYANNTPEEMQGAYLELGINLLDLFNSSTKRNLTLFGRYEYVNLDAETPANGIENGADQQHYFISGLAYFPIKGIAIKLDYVLRTSGSLNPALNLNPFGPQPVYYTSNGFINLGIGYSF
jgi:hypothetical protein